MTKANEYQCANCGGIFGKGWSDEEACQESELFFGAPNAVNDSRFVVVCDPCFQKMHPQDNPELVEQARIELQREPKNGA